MASKGALKNNKIIFFLIGIVMLGVFVGSTMLFSNVYKTETYYVLTDPVPGRTQVTPEMLTPVTTQEGTAPKAALDIAAVQGGTAFTRYPLAAGEILTASNLGGLEDIAVGIPDSWVVTSFPVPADNAAGGRIGRGVYFDMMLVTDAGTYYPFVNMLALDTTVSLSGASNANAINTDEAKMGQSQWYYVGMTPADAATLQHMVNKYGSNIRLVMSPRENEYQKPNLAAYESPTGSAFTFDLNSIELKNSGEGTDNTFVDPERDDLGRPADRDGDKVKYSVKCGNSRAAVAQDGNCETIDNNTYEGLTSE